jgi:hypothetical protein
MRSRPTAYLLAGEGAPVLDVSDGERVRGVWVTHCEVCVEVRFGIE